MCVFLLCYWWVHLGLVRRSQWLTLRWKYFNSPTHEYLFVHIQTGTKCYLPPLLFMLLYWCKLWLGLYWQLALAPAKIQPFFNPSTSCTAGFGHRTWRQIYVNVAILCYNCNIKTAMWKSCITVYDKRLQKGQSIESTVRTINRLSLRTSSVQGMKYNQTQNRFISGVISRITRRGCSHINVCVFKSCLIRIIKSDATLVMTAYHH